MNAERLDKFSSAYKIALIDAVNDYPMEYSFPVEQVDLVVERMRSAFIEQSYNKEGRAIRAVCRMLNIRHTYKDINTFFIGE
jgi:hypothetical protein